MRAARRFSANRMAVCAVLVTCVGWCAGCGRGAPPTGSISGRVTYRGKPITSGMVLLLSEEMGIGATGELDAHGSYRIPPLQTGDYKVAITRPPQPEPHELDGGAPMVDLSVDLPRELTSPLSSGLSTTVAEGHNTLDFDL